MSAIPYRLASTGLLSPCEWPVTGYGENRSGNLDNASIWTSTVTGCGENRSGSLDNANFPIRHR